MRPLEAHDYTGVLINACGDYNATYRGRRQCFKGDACRFIHATNTEYGLTHQRREYRHTEPADRERASPRNSLARVRRAELIRQKLRCRQCGSDMAWKDITRAACFEAVRRSQAASVHNVGEHQGFLAYRTCAGCSSADPRAQAQLWCQQQQQRCLCGRQLPVCLTNLFSLDWSPNFLWCCD